MALVFVSCFPVFAAEKEITYHGHVAPIVERACLGCHGGKRPKGKFNVESLEGFLAGGRKQGKTVVPGKPDESLVYKLLTGTEKPVMPPKKAEPLSEAEILTFHAWIAGGAKVGEPSAIAKPYSVPPKPVAYPRAPVIAALAYSADGKRLFVGGYREVLVHDVEALVAAKEKTLAPVARLVGEAERIHALSLSPDGKRLLVAAGSPGRFGEVQSWDVDSGEMLKFRRIGKDVLYGAEFAPDGKHVVVTGTDRTLYVLQSESLEDAVSAEIHSDWVFGSCFTADGSKLFSGGRDKTLKVTDAKTGKFLKTVVTFGNSVTGVLRRPKGDQILAWSETGEARLYAGSKDFKEQRKLESLGGAALAAAFSTDGTRLAIAGSKNEIRVYDSNSGKRVATLPAGPEWIFALAFRPDGYSSEEGSAQLSAAGYDGVVRIFGLKESKQLAEVIPVTLEGR